MRVLRDAGWCTRARVVRSVRGRKTVLLHSYRCPPKHCRDCPRRQACTPNPAAGRSISRGEHENLIEALREPMGTAEAKELYRLRSQSVEWGNADWKQHRRLRRFSGRGLTRVRCQLALVAFAHNLITLLAEEKRVKPANVNPQRSPHKSWTISLPGYNVLARFTGLWRVGPPLTAGRSGRLLPEAHLAGPEDATANAAIPIGGAKTWRGQSLESGRRSGGRRMNLVYYHLWEKPGARTRPRSLMEIVAGRFTLD